MVDWNLSGQRIYLIDPFSYILSYANSTKDRLCIVNEGNEKNLEK